MIMATLSSTYFMNLTVPPGGITLRGMIEDIQSRALHRTKILQGQLKGLDKMIASEEYCMDILTQSLAIQKSLSSLNKLIVENHIRTHVKDSLAHGSKEDSKRTITELLSLYELNNRRGK